MWLRVCSWLHCDSKISYTTIVRHRNNEFYCEKKKKSPERLSDLEFDANDRIVNNRSHLSHLMPGHYHNADYTWYVYNMSMTLGKNRSFL